MTWEPWHGSSGSCCFSVMGGAKLANSAAVFGEPWKRFLSVNTRAVSVRFPKSMNINLSTNQKESTICCSRFDLSSTNLLYSWCLQTSYSMLRLLNGILLWLPAAVILAIATLLVTATEKLFWQTSSKPCLRWLTLDAKRVGSSKLEDQFMEFHIMVAI